MPLPDFITSTIILASPPLGVPSLTIPLGAAVLTAPQNAAWDAEYGASVDVISVSPSTWQDVLSVLGVLTGEDLQVALTDMFSQRVDGQQSAPDEVLIGRRADPVAQVWTATVNAFEVGTYTVTIGGLSWTGTPSTDFNVPGNTDEPTTASDIRAAINAGSVPVTASGAGNDIVLTADNPGVPVTVSVTHSATPANITAVLTTANVGIGEDIATWRAQDDRWYFLVETTHEPGVIQAAAETIEALSRNRIFVPQTHDALAQTGASTADLASTLGSAGLGLTRTAIRWDPDGGQFQDWAIVGKAGGFLPGAFNWVHQSLASVIGVGLPELTNTAVLETKRYSWLERYDAPVPPETSTRGGKMLDGTFIDLAHLVDDLNLRIQIRVYGSLQDNNTPYRGGEDTVRATITGALNERAGPPGQGALVEGSITVTVPPADEQEDIDRLERRYAGVVWTAQTQGFVNNVVITGYLEQ